MVRQKLILSSHHFTLTLSSVTCSTYGVISALQWKCSQNVRLRHDKSTHKKTEAHKVNALTIFSHIKQCT